MIGIQLRVRMHAELQTDQMFVLLSKQVEGGGLGWEFVFPVL